MNKTPEKTAEFVNALDDLSGRVDALEEIVYGGPEDEMCPDCRFDMLMDSLDALDDEQLEELIDAAEGALEERSQESVKEGIEGDDDEDMTIDTKDGLLSDFIIYCLNHPEERFWQAARNWSGYTFIFGSTAASHDDYSQLEDTFNKTTKGPKQ